MIPSGSWPSTSPGSAPVRPSYMCRSVPQIALEVISTTTSSGSSSTASSTVWGATFRVLWKTIAFIRVAAWRPWTSGQGGNAAPPLASHAYPFQANQISLVAVRTAYKCRAYPASQQQAMLARTFGCVRVVWNRTLAWRHQRYYGEQVKTGFTQANAYLTAMKATPELAWLNEVPSVPLQQAIRHQQVAYTNFFAKRARYPRFKSRTGRQSAEYTRSGFRYRDGALFLA